MRIWCNAASTGEEPYSLAMTVVETLGMSAPVKLVCSDIDTKVLATAQPRRVRRRRPRPVARAAAAHFLRGTGRQRRQHPRQARAGPLIEFRSFNLMSRDWSSLGEPFDIVFCRNVMIYFDNPTQRKVLERMHGVMKPGGLLYVGHSENFTDSRDLFRCAARRSTSASDASPRSSAALPISARRMPAPHGPACPTAGPPLGPGHARPPRLDQLKAQPAGRARPRSSSTTRTSATRR
jgi:chemotaxis methyl-accepting protein methylase